MPTKDEIIEKLDKLTTELDGMGVEHGIKYTDSMLKEELVERLEVAYDLLQRNKVEVKEFDLLTKKVIACLVAMKESGRDFKSVENWEDFQQQISDPNIRTAYFNYFEEMESKDAFRVVEEIKQRAKKIAGSKE